MQDPRSEIADVVRTLVTGSADEQTAALKRYFVSNAAFNHPLCIVKPSQHSRDVWLSGIYTWYKIMSPSPKHTVEVHNVWYDDQKLEIVLDMSQTFHIFLSPFKPHPARLMTKLCLMQENDRYYITSQEDRYMPEDLAYLVLPPLATLVHLAKRVGTFGSIMGAYVGQTFFGQRLPREVA